MTPSSIPHSSQGRLARPQPRRGIFEKPFWDFVAAHEVRLQCCTDCGRLRYPPGPLCPHCLSERCEWRPLSGRGRLVAWTLFHRRYFPELPVPYIAAAVETAEGPLLIANLVNLDGQEPVHGMELRLTFETATGTDGDWTIYQWEPAG